MTGPAKFPGARAEGGRPGPADQEEVVRVLRRELEPVASFALLFGSAAGPNFRDDSDVDAAVFFVEPVPDLLERLALADRISQSTRRETDLVALNGADPIITMQALANGELILCRDRSSFVLFRAEALSRYMDFKTSRKIVEDHMANGRIYA